MVPAAPVYHPVVVPGREPIQIQPAIFGEIIALEFDVEDDLELELGEAVGILYDHEAVPNCIVAKVIQLVLFSIGNDGKVGPATSIPTFQTNMQAQRQCIILSVDP